MGKSKTKIAREEYPTSWMFLSQNESLGYIIDALMDLPQHREFNQSELAEMSGVSRNSVVNHIDILLALDIVEPVEGTSPTRFRFNPESGVSEALIRLEGEVNEAIEKANQEQAA